MPEGEEHSYEACVRWSGSTAGGWRAYDRTHAGTAPGADATVALTTGEGHGAPGLLNPEQLVVMAAASCQLLWFLHVAAVARVDVVEYEDRARAVMPLSEKPVRLARVLLRPRIVVAPGPTEERVRRLVETAHRECYVANSLSCPVDVEPSVAWRN